MGRFFLVWVTLSIVVWAARAQDTQNIGAKGTDSKDEYYYSYYDEISSGRDKDGSNDADYYNENDFGDALDENNAINGDDFMMEYGLNPEQQDKKTTEFCPWPPCYNDGESKSFEEILDIEIKTTPEPKVPEEPVKVVLEEMEIKANGEEIVEAVVLTEEGSEQDEAVIDYDYEAGAKELESDCDNPETVIIYKNEAPNGVIITSVVFFVILIAVVFYMPKIIRMRQEKAANVQDSTGLIEVPQYDPGHDGYDSDVENQNQYMSNIRGQGMPTQFSVKH